MTTTLEQWLDALAPERKAAIYAESDMMRDLAMITAERDAAIHARDSARRERDVAECKLAAFKRAFDEADSMCDERYGTRFVLKCIEQRAAELAANRQ